MRTLIVALLLLLAIGTVNAQTTGWSYHDGGISFHCTVTLDSASNKTYTTDYYDWTLIDGQSLYLTYSLVQANWDYAAGNDTVSIIILGKDMLGNVIKIDTQKIVSNTTQALASGQAALSLSGYAPRVAVYITPTVTGATTRRNGKNGLLKFTVYSSGFDVIPPRNKIYW